MGKAAATPSHCFTQRASFPCFLVTHQVHNPALLLTCRFAVRFLICSHFICHIQMCTSNAVSDKELYPTFARTIFGDNSISPSVLAILKYFNWNRVGIISEDAHTWESRGDFLVSYLKSQGKIVSLQEKVKFNWLYKTEIDGEHFQQVLMRMKTKARSMFMTKSRPNVELFMRRTKLSELISLKIRRLAQLRSSERVWIVKHVLSVCFTRIERPEIVSGTT